jgi:hypothetical protein
MTEADVDDFYNVRPPSKADLKVVRITMDLMGPELCNRLMDLMKSSPRMQPATLQKVAHALVAATERGAELEREDPGRLDELVRILEVMRESAKKGAALRQ